MSSRISEPPKAPQIEGTRIVVYDLLPYLEAGLAHADITAILSLNAEQFAAAMRYLDDHHDEVWAEHRRIEERVARGNAPEVDANLQQAGRRLELFKQWRREQPAAPASLSPNDRGRTMAEFERWLAARQARNGEHAS